MTFNYPRRRPSRRLIWLLSILTVVVVGFVLATTLRSERRLLAEYLDTAQGAAALAASASAEFQSLLRDLSTMDRATFTSTMRGVRDRAGEADRNLNAIEVPSSAVAAHARLTTAMSSWAAGLDVFQGGVLDAADRPTDDVPENLLRSAIIDLAVGDDSYQSATLELMAVETEADVEFTDYPTVVYVPTDLGWEDVAEAARRAPELALNIDVAIAAVGLEPRILRVEGDGTGVLPFTDRLIVNTTVVNQGNEPVTDIIVSIELGANRFGAGADDTSSIGRLDPGESTSLEFVFPLATSVDYRLQVRAVPTSGETDTGNNVVIQRFYVNDEE